MPPLGRMLIITGAVVIVLGLVLSYTHIFSSLRLGRLPGDISIKRGNFTFFFPVTTCLLLSAALALLLYFFRK